MSECKAALSGSHVAVTRALDHLDRGDTDLAKIALRVEERRLRRLLVMLRPADEPEERAA